MARLAGLLSYGVSQLSFFSAESVPPAVADLTGVLAAAGQMVLVGGGARLSVVVDEPWRAAALAEMITRGRPGSPRSPAPTKTHPLVRTAVGPAVVRDRHRMDAGRGQDGAAAVAARAAGAAGLDAGRRQSRRPTAICSGLDPHAPDTHSPLASALMRVGIAPTLIGTRGARPALANQRPPTAIAPGRERGGTARR